MTDHQFLEKSNLLGGPLSAAARSAWPRWAAEHFETCPECQALLEADAVFRRLAARRPTHRAAPPPPNIAALLDRKPAIKADPHALIRLLVPLPVAPFRDNPLQLLATEGGVRAIDASPIRQISAFRVGSGFAVRHLGTRCFDSVAGSFDIDVAVDERVRVVAVALAQRVDPELLSLWLSDAMRQGGEAWRGSVPADRAHVQERTLLPVATPLPLRLRANPYPESSPEVAALVESAADAGRHGEERRAGALFVRARELALAAGDEGAVVRCTLGVASVLLSLGFHDDSGLVLDELVGTTALTPPRASQATRAHAWRALLADDPTRAERWLEEARKIDPDSAWIPPIEWHVAAWKRDSAATLAAARRDELAVSPTAHLLRDSVSAIAHVDAGDIVAARAALPTPQPSAPREVQLWQAVADARVRGVAGEASPGLPGTLANILADAPPGELSVWEARPLAYAAGWFAAHANPAAGELLRMRFLKLPLFGGERGLFLASSPFGLILQLPTGETHRLGVSRETLVGLVQTLRTTVITGGDPAGAADVLRGLLRLDREVPRARLVVASDGPLSGVPWSVVLGSPAADAELVAVTEACGRGAGLLQCSTSREVVSIADALGDLPMSARECDALDPVRCFTGERATWGALCLAADAGVLHLGLHVRRDSGVPMLQLADALVSPIELGALTFTNRPVVFLAGCATAGEPRTWGVERALAEAFLLAGASAVVATRWPLQDAEAHALFSPLLRWDAISNLEMAIAASARALRERGVPPRVWSAAAVFRA